MPAVLLFVLLWANTCCWLCASVSCTVVTLCESEYKVQTRAALSFFAKTAEATAVLSWSLTARQNFGVAAGDKVCGARDLEPQGLDAPSYCAVQGGAQLQLVKEACLAFESRHASSLRHDNIERKKLLFEYCHGMCHPYTECSICFLPLQPFRTE